MKRIVLTGGGTAGHVTPNIALLPGLKERGYEARVHCLDAGADDLGHVGRAVDDQGHGQAPEGAEAQGREHERHDEVADVQLQQDGRAPDHLHEGGDQEAQDLDPGHLHQGQQRAQDGAEEDRDDGQGQRDADALDEEHVPVLDQDLDDVLEDGGECHGFLRMLLA